MSNTPIKVKETEMDKIKLMVSGKARQDQADDQFIGWAQSRTCFGRTNGGGHVARCIIRGTR